MCGSKDHCKYVSYELQDNCSSPVSFSGGELCSSSFLNFRELGGGGVGLKDSGFRSIILKKVIWRAEK